MKAARVGWLAADTLETGERRLEKLLPPVSMRITNVARWINENAPHVCNEIYRPERKYDVAVFFKAMSERYREEARRVQSYGGRVIFDANVNYYEDWGEYERPEARPTKEQQRDVDAMTRLADHVVADSSYLRQVIEKINPSVTWIPDNVDTTVYCGMREHRAVRPVRIVWSGSSVKAAQPLLLADVLRGLRGVELDLVTDRVPAAIGEIRALLPTRLIGFSDRWYAWTLRNADIIIAPKRPVSSYEVAHTEYKISLGMAVGLPAVASPQPSYVDAIGYLGGGIVADSDEEWRDALERLAGDHVLRARLGALAQRTIKERYATAVVAPRYLAVLESLL
jgi:glycosyltransferase involved in cell wall biosynthesis